MIPTYEMDDDQWNKLVQDVADHFGEVMINRGFQYFKRGRVVKLTIPEERVAKAVVEGGDLYHVTLRLDAFASSRCDCPVGSYCKHLFAAILKYADLHNRPIHALVNAKSMSRATASSPAPSSASASYNQARQEAAKKAADDLQLLKQQARRIGEMSVPQWHAWFALAAERLLHGPRNTQFVNDALAAIYRHKPSLPAAVDAFFVLHAHLFVLSNLTKQPQDQSGYVYSYLAFHTHHAASELQEAIGQRIGQLSSLAGEPANATFVAKTVAYLRREMLAETNDNRYFLNLYLNVWSEWLLPSGSAVSLGREELRRLKETASELAIPKEHYAYRVSQAAVNLFQDRDGRAWELLEEAAGSSGLPAETFSPLLGYLTKGEHWERLADGLARLAPMLGARRSGELRGYADYWEFALRHRPEAEPRMWEALVSLLPLSKPLYEEKLIEREQWERWMDYHLSLDSDPMDFRVAELAPIEKNAPELLLPFYHQAVERYVLLKNRDSYKSAVKLLKRLAKLYKKLKREPRWDDFLAAFAGRHSRLRALQEELRKGKLLHDE